MTKLSQKLTVFLLIIMFALNYVCCREDVRTLSSIKVTRSRTSTRTRSSSGSGSSSGGVSSSSTSGGSTALIIILVTVIPAVVVFIIIIICRCRRRQLLAKQQVTNMNNDLQMNKQKDLNSQMQACNAAPTQQLNQQNQVFMYPNQHGYQNQQQLQVLPNNSYQQNPHDQSYLYFQQPAIQQASIL